MVSFLLLKPIYPNFLLFPPTHLFWNAHILMNLISQFQLSYCSFSCFWILQLVILNFLSVLWRCISFPITYCCHLWFSSWSVSFCYTWCYLTCFNRLIPVLFIFTHLNCPIVHDFGLHWSMFQSRLLSQIYYRPFLSW